MSYQENKLFKGLEGDLMKSNESLLRYALVTEATVRRMINYLYVLCNHYKQVCN